MSRKRTPHTKETACRTVAKGLQDWGYPETTTAMVREILDAWLAGKRGDDLPHGVIGAFAESQFNEIESERPGALAAMEDK